MDSRGPLAPAPAPTHEDPAMKYLGEALKTSFAIFKLLMLAVVVLFLGSGMFTVGQHERGLIMRFGKFVGGKLDMVKEPGWHWAWPYPVDSVVIVPVNRVQSVRTWAFWPRSNRTRKIEGKAEPLPESQLMPGADGVNFTADRNLIHTVWSVRYQIDDPVAYVRNLANPAATDEKTRKEKEEALLRYWLQHSVIEVIGGFNVDDVLRRRKAELVEQVEKKMRRDIEKLNVGLSVESVLLERVEPPGRVKKDFDSVVKTGQETSKQIEEAKGYRATIVSEAEGIADKIKAEAEAYKQSIVKTAQGDAEYMQKLLAKCRRPDGQVDQKKLGLYLEDLRRQAIADFLSSAEELFVLRPKGPNDVRQLRLLINRDPQAAKDLEAQRKKAEEKPEEEDISALMPKEE